MCVHVDLDVSTLAETRCWYAFSDHICNNVVALFTHRSTVAVAVLISHCYNESAKVLGLHELELHVNHTRSSCIPLVQSLNANRAKGCIITFLHSTAVQFVIHLWAPGLRNLAF